jgi:tellurite resistance protein
MSDIATPDPGREAALFLQLVLGLQQAAMMSLGKLMNPMTGKIERNLEAARNTIDTLSAIEARTRGNLEPDEQRVLTQVLTDLRMNYLDEMRKKG